MISRAARRFALLQLLLAAGAIATVAQTVPADFRLIATAGGAFPGGSASATTTIELAADGSAAIHRLHSSSFDTGDPETTVLSLSASEVAYVWQAIEANSFFGLQSSYGDPAIRDRTFARVVVEANGTTHAVTTRNVAVESFDNIVSAINSVTSATDNLEYDVSTPFTFLPVAICEQPGKRGVVVSKADVASDGLTSVAGVVSSITAARGALVADNQAHPGTVIAYNMPIAQAVQRRVATLTAKGEHFGDAVKIDVDNSANVMNDNLRLTLYLELWGSGASASIASVVENAIESTWSGVTSGGTTFTVDVITRVSPGGTDAPGTPGFHQIQMTPDSTFRSGVHEVGDPFDVNVGTGAGTWSSIGSNLEKLYAHEAGHLFGLEDRYEQYDKQPDGSWMRESDGQVFTPEQLADEIAPQHPDLSHAEVLERIQKPGRNSFTSPQPGHVDNLMGSLKGTVRQSDIDALAAQAGLLVQVRPGDVFVNKFSSRQNLGLIRSEDIFAPKGGTATLEGLYAICLDRSRGTPHAGDVFDLAPPLAEWNGFEVRDHLKTLLTYLDTNELFCPADAFAQSVVWRLTNNSGMADDNVAAYLTGAGIDVGYRELDFPRLTNPNFAAASSGILTPPQLFVPDIVTSSGPIADVLQSLSFSADLSAPSSDGISPLPSDFGPTYSWSLESPDESAALLDATQGDISSFTPDVRGFYELTLRADLPDSVTGVSDGGSGGTFRQEATLKMVAVDAQVETFESGTLDPEGPFLWTTGAHAWSVTDDLSHTGSFSAVSAPIGDGERSVLQTRFEQVEAGTLSFSYRLFAHFSDSLLFLVDGEVLERWNGGDPWTTVSVDLPAGVHTATWIYLKDQAESIGADRAWLDDVFFPKSALFTGVDRLETPDDPPAVDALVLRLMGNYPNPFTTSTTIAFEISDERDVELTVFDAVGRRVSVLVDSHLAAGRHTTQFNAATMAGGVYYYELRAGTAIGRRAMVLMR